MLKLGSGTGNLSELIASCGELVSVDVSGNLETVVKLKVRHLAACCPVGALFSAI